MSSEIRDAYFDRLLAEMSQYDPSILLTIDMGAKSFSVPEKRGRARILNCGVSEANAVSVAAGLSSRGVKAFVYGISSFLMNRPRAQIRHDAVIGNNAVHLIGSGPGLAYDRDGPSHHSLDDIALARTLPNLSVYSPFDRASAERAVVAAMKSKGTTYCRLDKGVYPDVSHDLASIGGVYCRFADLQHWIICTGVQTHAALAESAKSGQTVASLFEIGPATIDELGRLIPRGTTISIMDESHESGGVLQLIGETNLISNLNLRLACRGLKNRFVQEKLDRLSLHGAYSE